MQQKGVQAGSVGTGGVSFASDAIKRGGGGGERENFMASGAFMDINMY